MSFWFAALLTAASASQQPTNALPAERSGADIYGAACATCHGRDGHGGPQPQLGFTVVPRDFTDCTTSAETTPDWSAVVHEGGPIRGLDRHMPAFGDALTADDIAKVVAYIKNFCAEPKRWPSGDLNFPRAFFTEKAFPENETVWTMSMATGHQKAVSNDVTYERRIGARSQFEANVPIDFQQNFDKGEEGHWVAGIGDIALAFRHTFLASADSGTIAAAGFETAIPTGNEFKDLGNAYFVYEPFAMFGQALPANSYLQMHAGVELPSKFPGQKEGYLRTGIGTTFMQNRGFGRAWSPQMEILLAKPFGDPYEWDVVPQLQVSLSKLQHILIAGGVRVPVTQTDTRKPAVLMYFVWDWFDGGLFQFWK